MFLLVIAEDSRFGITPGLPCLVITKKHAVRIAGKIWLSGGRELDLEVVCRRGVKNYLSDCHRDVPQFKKNPVNPTLTKRGSAWI
jgi:hypothetical protein